MKTDKRADYLTREDVLKALSDEEIASVGTAETAHRLSEGDEYLDLEDLGRGVRRASGAQSSMNVVLPRKAVHENTWSKIVQRLASVATNHAGA